MLAIVAAKIEMKIDLIEQDEDLQDVVLTMHHAYMTTFQRSQTLIIENNMGKGWVITTRNPTES